MRRGIDQTILSHDVEKISKKFYVAIIFYFFIKEPSKTVSIYIYPRTPLIWELVTDLLLDVKRLRRDNYFLDPR